MGDSQALLEECHAAYCSARRSLMTGKVMNDIRGLDPTRSELVDLVVVLSNPSLRFAEQRL